MVRVKARMLAFLQKGSSSPAKERARYCHSSASMVHMEREGINMKRLLSLATLALTLSVVGSAFAPSLQTASAANNAIDQFANVELPPTSVRHRSRSTFRKPATRCAAISLTTGARTADALSTATRSRNHSLRPMDSTARRSKTASSSSASSLSGPMLPQSP
jgi:hypothetical protein